jgi:hypothetical protein
MAATQLNRQWFTYVDDQGNSFNKLGEDGGPLSAVDGHAASGAHPVWIDTKRHSTRKVEYQDPTTFRTVKGIVYTAAAYAAIAVGDIVAVTVPGEVAAVNYTVSRKIPERQTIRTAAFQLADHA